MGSTTSSSTVVKKLVLGYTSHWMRMGPFGISATGRPQSWR